jgi:hypothetical protein
VPNRLPVALAINDYDHVRDLASGVVPVEGVALNVMHCSLRAAGDDSLVAVPVFISRAFRHSAIFVRDDGPVDRPSELSGGRIGIPEWTQTATVYGRAILQHEFGIGLRDVTWIQAGTNEPGRTEGVAATAPEGVTVVARRRTRSTTCSSRARSTPSSPRIRRLNSYAGQAASFACAPTTASSRRSGTSGPACSRSCTCSRCAPTSTSATPGSR